MPLVFSVGFHLVILGKERERVIDVELWRCLQTGRNRVVGEINIEGVEHIVKTSEMLSARDFGKMDDSVVSAYSVLTLSRGSVPFARMSTA